MRQVYSVEFKPGSREELLPDFDPSFPHILTRYDLVSRSGAPWHWHKAVELFYVEDGVLEYSTPSGQYAFPSGWGGFVNSNVLHSSFCPTPTSQGRQLLHLFDPLLISGSYNSRMESRYVLPLTASPRVEILTLQPEDPAQSHLLELLRRSFALSPQETGYEFHLRAILCEIWLGLLDLAASAPSAPETVSQASRQLKDMLIYIHEHAPEHLSVPCIAAAAHISQRTCYTLFRTHLRTTPMEYVASCRLSIACELLRSTTLPITEVALRCGLGSSSYFSRLFSRTTGMTPLEYRKNGGSP